MRKGQKHSPETREKMRLARLGRKFGPRPDEVRKKISETKKKGWKEDPESMGGHTGCKHSDEAKEKMRAARKKWWADKKAEEQDNEEG